MDLNIGDEVLIIGPEDRDTDEGPGWSRDHMDEFVGRKAMVASYDDEEDRWICLHIPDTDIDEYVWIDKWLQPTGFNRGTLTRMIDHGAQVVDDLEIKGGTMMCSYRRDT